MSIALKRSHVSTVLTRSQVSIAGKARTVGKFLAGSAYCLVFAECFLRLFAPVALFPRYVTAAPYGVRVNEPNREYWHTSPDVRIQIRTNSKGIRADSEIPYEPTVGVKRILVLGDSFAMGYEATLEGMFTTQMTNFLREQGFEVEVVNLAVSGHSNAEELIVFREEGRKYHPDLVLLCWHASDLGENVRSALFDLDGEHLVPKNASYLPGIDIQRQLYRIPAYEWLSNSSHLYSWVREAASVKVIKPLLLLVEELRISSNQTQTISSDVVDDHMHELTVRLLEDIQKSVRETGADFMLLDIPVPVGDHDFTSSLPKAVSRVVDPAHLVSPITAFESHRDIPLYHTRSHRHFTPIANKLVGELLATTIVKNRLFGPIEKSLPLGEHHTSNQESRQFRP